MSNVAYIVKESGVTLFKDGKQFSAPSDFWSYDRIIKKIKDKDYDGIESLFNTKEAVEQVHQEIAQEISNLGADVRFVDGEVFVGERKVYNSVTKRLISMLKAGFDVNPLSNFLKRLLKNPSKTAMEELYPFMEKADVTIDAEGFIIAYKKVRDDYFDIYSGTVNYNIGNIVEMPRNEVDDNRTNLCSDGLHFCSFSYLSHFGAGTGNRVLIVKIDPADVVSIPADYNDAKARACRMEVIGQVEESKASQDVLAKTPVLKKTASAPAQVTNEVRDTGSVAIFTQFSVNSYDDMAKVLSKKIGKTIHLVPIGNRRELEPKTLSQITAIYNDIVSVYNVIQDGNRLAHVAMFKCSKEAAITKLMNVSDLVVEWYEQNKG